MIKPFLKLGSQFGTDPNINPGNPNPQSSNFILLENGVTVKYIGSTAGEQGFLNGTLYTAVDNTMLQAMNPLTDDYTTVCTTLCTNMNELFRDTSFNQDISHWDVSNVTNMRYIFRNSNFNQDINSWDISNVNTIIYAFADCPFNQPLNNWDVSNITNMEGLFRGNSNFNQPLNNWDVSNVSSMIIMFFNSSSFNQDLSTWCVEQIPTEPTDFATGATAWVLPKPNWGAPC